MAGAVAEAADTAPEPPSGDNPATRGRTWRLWRHGVMVVRLHASDRAVMMGAHTGVFRTS